MLRLLLLSLLLFPAGANAGKTERLSREEKRTQALENWGNRVRGSLGPLLTPPRGAIDPEVSQTRAEIAAIIEKIAGEKLAATGIQLEINIYAASSPNAFAANAANFYPGKKNKAERRLIRKVLGAGNTPVYELAVSTDLLRKVGSEDELAFILGHELSHMFEGHTDANGVKDEALKRWWSSQSYEVAADYEGLKLIEGKYDLGGALSVMAKLHEGKSSYSPYDFLADGTSDHHQEGVRFSLLQGAIERMRRQNTAAGPRALTPVPAYMKLNRAGREKVFSKSFANKSSKIIDEVVDKYLLPGKPFPLGMSYDEEILVPDRYRGLNYGDSASFEQIRDSFWKNFEKIRASSATKQAKNDAALRMMLFFAYGVESPDQYTPALWNHFTPPQLKELTLFLAENAAGANAWNAEKFITNLGASHAVKVLPNYFTQNPALLKQFDLLTKTSPAWKTFFPTIFMSALEPEGKVSLDGLRDLIDSLAENKTPEPQFIQDARKFVIDYVHSKDWVKVLGTLDAGDLQHTIGNILAPNWPHVKNGADAWVKEIKSAFEPLGPVMQARVVATAFPNASTFTAEEYSRGVFSLLGIDEGSMKPEVDALLQKRIMEAATHFYTVAPPESTLGMYFHTNMFYRRIARLLADSNISAEQKNHLVDWAASLNTLGGVPEPVDPALAKTMRENFRKYFEGWDAERFRQFIDLDASPGTEAALAADIKQPKKMEFNERIAFLLAERRKARMEGIVSLLSTSDPEVKARMADRLSLADLAHYVDRKKAMEASLQKITRRPPFPRGPANPGNMEVSGFLAEILMRHQNEAKSYSEWKSAYSAVIEEFPQILDTNQRYRKELLPFLQDHWFKTMSLTEVAKELEDPNLRALLGPDELADYLSRFASAQLGGAAFDQIKAESLVKEMEGKYDLAGQAETRTLFKQKLLESLHAQPGQAAQIFPDLTSYRTTTQLLENMNEPVRGASALVGLSQGQTPAEQVKLIDYLLGNQDEIPAYFNDVVKKLGGQLVPVANNTLISARAKLMNANGAERTLAVNSFLAGPHGLAEKPEGLKFIMDKLMGGVDPKNKELAQVIGASLLEANGDMKSLALSFMLAQKRTGKILTEADLLAAGLMLHGVPGAKFGQYLGFTEAFRAYADHFADFQDQFSPITYAEAIELIEKRFGKDWPADKEVVGLIGFGSVNIAAELKDKKTGAKEVISLLRDDVQAGATESFRKLNGFLQALAKRKLLNVDFDVYLGLSKIIEKSVALEFNKEAAFKMQQQVFKRYHGKIGGWNIESVPAFEVSHDGIFMQKAEGITAKKLLRQDPELYRSAMRAMSQVEMDVLLGIDEDGNPHPVLLHANPDFHDGQVVVDVPNRRVQLLDFGQAVSITNEERFQAMDLLRVVSGLEKPESALKILNDLAIAHGGKEVFALQDVTKILGSTKDRMDLFVKIISTMSNRGSELPLPIVHWVLGVHRQIELGKKIGVNNEAVIRNLLLSRKLGLAPSTYLRSHILVQEVKNGLADFKRGCKEFFSGLIKAPQP